MLKMAKYYTFLDESLTQHPAYFELYTQFHPILDSSREKLNCMAANGHCIRHCAIYKRNIHSAVEYLHTVKNTVWRLSTALWTYHNVECNANLLSYDFDCSGERLDSSLSRYVIGLTNKVTVLGKNDLKSVIPAWRWIDRERRRVFISYNWIG